MIFYIILHAFLGTILAVSLFIYFKVVCPQKRLYDSFKVQGVPCEPFVPIFGQLFDLIRANQQNKALEYFNDLAQKHGYCFLFGMGILPRLLLLEPELLADVLSRSKSEYYEKTSFLINSVKPFIGVHNLLLSKNDEHERARKMLNPAFHAINIQSMVSIMSNTTVKTIDALLLTCILTDSIRLDTHLSSLTLSILASSALGQSFEMVSDAKDILYETLNEAKDILDYRTSLMINQIKLFDELPFCGKHMLDEAIENLNQFVDQSIADRRSGKSASVCSGQDLLDFLLSAVDDQGESFSDQQIRDEVLTFILAGHETTANLLTWALYLLMLHDNVLQVCREEVDRVLPNRAIPTYAHLADLQVIEAVLHETLRLYPPYPLFARQCIKAHTIANANGESKIHIPVGTMIIINSYVLHRRADYWPCPLEFNYKRWMCDPVTGLKPKLSHPYAYLPFAAGPRNCIGQTFALFEAKVILAMFVQRCVFKLVPGQPIVPELRGVSMPPKYGIFANLRERELQT